MPEDLCYSLMESLYIAGARGAARHAATHPRAAATWDRDDDGDDDDTGSSWGLRSHCRCFFHAVGMCSCRRKEGQQQQHSLRLAWAPRPQPRATSPAPARSQTTVCAGPWAATVPAAVTARLRVIAWWTAAATVPWPPPTVRTCRSPLQDPARSVDEGGNFGHCRLG